MGQFYKIDNPRQLDERLGNLKAELAGIPGDMYPVKITWEKYHPTRTVSQTALYFVWCREYARHLTGLDTINKDVEAQMSYTFIRHAYAEMGWEWLMTKNVDLETGEERPAPVSVKDIDKHNMSQFLEWVQMRAANQGLMLEIKGEYKELKQKQHET